ncbi:MAG: tyrosine-type recombinase/integrase [bacterium]|nr:tyrosine-type recombinase/integrase [bacterium]
MAEAKRLLLQAKRELGPNPRELSTRVDATFRALRNLAIVEVLFATGIRVGELVSLELADFRSEERAFTINGKGSRQRIALLPDKVSYHTVNTYSMHRCNVFTDHEALFLNTFSGPLSAQGVGILVGRLARDAGISHRVKPHMLQHTVASLRLRTGADIRVVQEFLGHAAISTKQRYTHITKDDLALKWNQYHPNILHLGR